MGWALIKKRAAKYLDDVVFRSRKRALGLLLGLGPCRLKALALLFRFPGTKQMVGGAQMPGSSNVG